MLSARRPSIPFRGLAALLVVSFPPMIASTAFADSHEDDGGAGWTSAVRERISSLPVSFEEWTPSFASGITIYSQDTKSDAQAIEVDKLGGGTTTLGDFGNVQNVDGAAFPLAGEMLGPRLEFLPGSPRPFFHGAILFSREGKSTLAAAGPRTEQNLQDDARVETRVRPKQLWYGGAGLAWQLPIESYPTSVKISLDYFGERQDVNGQVKQFIENPNSGMPGESNFAITKNGKTRGETYHGLGPAIGLDVEVARRGPFAFSVFGETRVAFLIDNPRVEVSVPPFDIPSNNDPAGESLHSFKQRPFHVNGTIGLRISFVGWPAIQDDE